MTWNYKKKIVQISGGIKFAAIETANSNSCPQIIGYARVSTDDQILDVQMSALRAAGCDHIFQETISAVNATRPQFALMMKHLEPGDTLVVHSLSRLGRDVAQIHGILKELAALGVKWRSTTEPHLDMATAAGRLMVNVTGAMAQFERDQIKERTKRGMDECRRKGMYLGRPRVVALKDIPKMQAMRKRGVKVPVIAEKFGCSIPCVYSHTKAS
jgi:DNA invertase Pin-like site-specific DNA recombinase